MIYKIVNQSLFLCDGIGNPGRRISENVNFATYDDTTKVFLITKSDGKLETKDINGNSIRVIHDGVLEARFSGNDIIVRKRDGRNLIIDRVGNIKRYI